ITRRYRPALLTGAPRPPARTYKLLFAGIWPGLVGPGWRRRYEQGHADPGRVADHRRRRGRSARVLRRRQTRLHRRGDDRRDDRRGPAELRRPGPQDLLLHPQTQRLSSRFVLTARTRAVRSNSLLPNGLGSSRSGPGPLLRGLAQPVALSLAADRLGQLGHELDHPRVLV